VSAAACVAVGSGTLNGGSFATVLRSGKWSSAKLSSPSSARNPLQPSISCVSATYCVAVATPQFSTHSVQWTRTGTRWSDVALASLSSSHLDTISCWAQGQCVAGGFEGVNALTARLNGSKWTFVTASPATGTTLTITGLSCVNATNCQGVGATTSTTAPSGDSAATYTLGQSGLTFEIQTRLSAPPTSISTETLSALSCPNVSNCVAIGTVEQIDVTGAVTSQGLSATN
jgi:hypothetical protein